MKLNVKIPGVFEFELEREPMPDDRFHSLLSTVLILAGLLLFWGVTLAFFDVIS